MQITLRSGALLLIITGNDVFVLPFAFVSNLLFHYFVNYGAHTSFFRCDRDNVSTTDWELISPGLLSVARTFSLPLLLGLRKLPCF